MRIPFSLLFIFTLFLGISTIANCQTSKLFIDTTHILIYDSVTNSSYDVSEYLGATSSYDTTLKFKFDTITDVDFAKYKKQYNSQISYDSSKIIWTDTSFIIKSKKAQSVFKVDKRDYSEFSYYFGFLTPLNLYLVQWIDGNNELGYLIVVDAKTGKQYYLMSPYDEPCQAPRISPDNNYLLSYANTWYEGDQCFISLMKINTHKKRYTLKSYMTQIIAPWQILDLVWIDDNSFALAVQVMMYPDDFRLDGVGINFYMRGTFGK